MKIKRYLHIQRSYGGSDIGIETDGGVKTIGSLNMPRDHETPMVAKESPSATDAKAKARAKEELAFAEMVIGHLNAGLQRGAMKERMSAMKSRAFNANATKK